MGFARRSIRIAVDAVYAFGDDDGWALASHIALSALLALFPFLIVLTALAGFLGSKDVADSLARPSGYFLQAARESESHPL